MVQVGGSAAEAPALARANAFRDSGAPQLLGDARSPLPCPPRSRAPTPAARRRTGIPGVLTLRLWATAGSPNVGVAADMRRQGVARRQSCVGAACG
jgi:hypothetical protein